MAERTITRAHEGRNHITYPYRLGAPPVFSQMVVGAEEAAVFTRHNHVIGSLGPGRHSMSPTGAPFLEQLRSTDGQRYECDIMFVTTGAIRMQLDGPIGTLTDTTGHPANFHLMGNMTVRAPDPVRVVVDGIGVGEGGDAFDRILVRRVMQGIQRELPKVFEGGLARPDDLPSLGPALAQAGQPDQLGAWVLGIQILQLEITRLVSERGLPPAGLDAADRRAEVAADEELPDHESCRFGAARIPFRDTDFDMVCHVSVVGYFQGDDIPGAQEQWLEEAIVKTVRQAAETWTGTVLDLPNRRDVWARYVTQVVVPELTKYTGLRGRVVIEAVELYRQEEAELKRRRAAALIGGR